VSSGPCTIRDGQVLLTTSLTATCVVLFCEAEPLAPRACGQASVTVTIQSDPPLEGDGLLASGGGGCASGGGTSLLLLVLFVWKSKRRALGASIGLHRPR
jgi:hypothetical protein